MSTEPPRHPPQSVVQASGQVAESIIGGFKGQPALLAIIVLNVLMMGGIFWFLHGVNDAVRQNRDQLMQMISRCLDHDGREDRQS